MGLLPGCLCVCVCGGGGGVTPVSSPVWAIQKNLQYSIQDMCQKDVSHIPNNTLVTILHCASDSSFGLMGHVREFGSYTRICTLHS